MQKPTYTNEQAREFFKDCELTYKDIKKHDIEFLLPYTIQIELDSPALYQSPFIETMKISKKTKIKYDKDGNIAAAFLFVNSHYFKEREAISFNADGFIGFAGWADTKNIQPFIHAFINWCTILKAKTYGRIS